jgi:small conductance mechanosensitive channel
MRRPDPTPWRRSLGGLCLSLALAAPASAQETQAPRPVDPTVRIETLEGLIGDLEDPERREEIVARLRALIDAAAPDGGAATPGPGPVDSAVAFVRQLGEQAGRAVRGIAAQIEAIPGRLRGLEEALLDPERRARLLTEVGLVLGLSLLALAVLAAVAFALRRPREAIARRRDGVALSPQARVGRLGLRLVLDGVAPGAALLVTFVGISLLPMSAAAGTVTVALVSAVVATAAFPRLLDAVLAPRDAELRLVPVADGAAQQLARGLTRLAAVAIVGYSAVAAVAALGAEVDLLDALRGLYALVLLVASVGFVLRFRRWPHGDLPEPARDAPRTGWRRVIGTLARLWWVAALVYSIGLYTLWVGGAADAFGRALRATGLTLAAVAAGIVAFGLVGFGLRKLASRVASATRSLPAIRRRVPQYLTICRVALGSMLALLVAGFVFEAWGVRALLLLQTTLMQTTLTAGLGVLAVVLLALVTIDVSTALTEAYLARREAGEEENLAKVRTLVPLAQKAIKLVVWVLAVVTVMGQVGISIGPILASIGVLGLAVGFGAQTLVKDVITGVFILLEDAVSVGDVVTIGGTGGLVEAINLRTIRLRDLSGVVHTIPYSTVGAFANLTKEFSYYLVECGVAYREDVDEVFGVLREIGAGMQSDPEFGPSILEPIEILGLDRFADSAVVLRARLKTRAARQWAVGREFNRRMKRAFDERGIEIPFPHRTVYIGQDKAGRSPPLFVADRRPGQDGRGDRESPIPSAE